LGETEEGCEGLEMRGRYGRLAGKQRIAEWMQAHDAGVFHDPYFAPWYNVDPQSVQPVFRLESEAARRQLTMMRWGLVPFWSKDGEPAFNAINARAETVTASPAFREAFRRRRCLAPTDRFHEWQNIDTRTRQSYAIVLRDRDLFRFHGLGYGPDLTDLNSPHRKVMSVE
jgi:putative SOS response-associated peptidase YedK